MLGAAVLVAAASGFACGGTPATASSGVVYTFNENLDGLYVYDGKPKSSPLGRWSADHAVIRGGMLVLKSVCENGRWVSAGVNTSPRAYGAKGVWRFRARFDTPGTLGFGILLYPKGGYWPPEIDVMEGGGSPTNVFSNLHLRRGDQNRVPWRTTLNEWHSYTVGINDNAVRVFVDGRPVAAYTGSLVPRGHRWWMAIQTEGKDGCKTGQRAGAYVSDLSYTEVR